MFACAKGTAPTCVCMCVCGALPVDFGQRRSSQQHDMWSPCTSGTPISWVERNTGPTRYVMCVDVCWLFLRGLTYSWVGIRLAVVNILEHRTGCVMSIERREFIMRRNCGFGSLTISNTIGFCQDCATKDQSDILYVVAMHETELCANIPESQFSNYYFAGVLFSSKRKCQPLADAFQTRQ